MLNDTTLSALEPHRERISFDAPIHRVADLASLFHADACNDCAPVSFHSFAPGAKLPRSPLQLPQGAVGFGGAD